MKPGTKKINENHPGTACPRSIMSRTGWRLFAALALWALTYPVAAVAQGWYWGSPVAPGYDLSSVVEVSGVVLHSELSKRGAGSMVRMDAGGEIFTVTLGPGWYLSQKRADIQIGDRIEVRGSKMKTRDGKMYLTAASLKNIRTGHTLELRDENGRPLWSSKRRLD